MDDNPFELDPDEFPEDEMDPLGLDEDYDEESLDDKDEEAETNDDSPTFRAIIRGETLTLTGWLPSLISGGPVGQLLRERERERVAIADLTILHSDDGREVLAHFLAGRRSRTARRRLTRWAQATGYARIWFDDDVIDLQDELAITGTFATKCPTCRAHWVESAAQFMYANRQAGVFPMVCMVCGGFVPQWSEVKAADATSPSRAAGTKSTARR